MLTPTFMPSISFASVFVGESFFYTETEKTKLKMIEGRPNGKRMGAKLFVG